jgi:hypothetical protein
MHHRDWAKRPLLSPTGWDASTLARSFWRLLDYLVVDAGPGVLYQVCSAARTRISLTATRRSLVTM